MEYRTKKQKVAKLKQKSKTERASSNRGDIEFGGMNAIPEEESDACGVCLGSMDDPVDWYIGKRCMHGFHVACVKKITKCPLCSLDL
jgi:hypothetical protein